MAAKVFKGANVFMSRNLVPPELFDALHDALKLNGAQVFLCCDPSRNAPTDYHVIASREHEKFEDLRSKGCNLLGPQCVLSCAKEHRPLPNQGFTCCLSMEGTNILATGFDLEEKAEIESMVTAMGGVLYTKTSSDVNFVIAKNVLAQKYKWALNTLKKPIVTIYWLLQCWKEHRVVPQDAYRVLPFSGLTICVSGIPTDERKEIEKLTLQNGGRYSPELTRKCTHLISPEGDKYKVAKKWGNICITPLKWFHQSVARRACLSEGSYPVQAHAASSACTLTAVEQHGQGRSTGNMQCTTSSKAIVSDAESNFLYQATEPDSENILPYMYSSAEDSTLFKDGNCSAADNQADSFDPDVAYDSQSEDDNLYLSECRIFLVGFEVSELRKLVNMVRRGGGSRYKSFNVKLTHVIVGNPSEIETKEVRSQAALGVIHVVKSAWLEECNCRKKEVPVLQRHIAYDILIPKATSMGMTGMKQGKSSVASQPLTSNIPENKNSITLDLKKEVKLMTESGIKNGIKHIKSSTVFKGKLFSFSSSFPEEQRPEIIQWVKEGGGEVLIDQTEKSVHFTVERHGAMPCPTDCLKSTYISSHWIHSCLEDGCLVDVGSHVLYSPLPCHVPLPGLEGYRICVSRYDLKEKQLLRNLCYVLGMKFSEKLNPRVTHLLCKSAYGDKYEVARKWELKITTAEWIYQCVKQNKVVDLNQFYPEEATSQDLEAGLCSFSQYPTQSAGMTFPDDSFQRLSQSQVLRDMQQIVSTKCVERNENLNNSSKRARVSANGNIKRPLCNYDNDAVLVQRKNLAENGETDKSKISSVVPDVAAAIEDLLEQTNKIQDQNSRDIHGCNENFLSSNSPLLGEGHANPPSDSGLSKHWMIRLDKRDDNPSEETAASGLYDGFSETQTESQVVGYEEDLSGRQMIIDRVRSGSGNMRTTTMA